jgi:histidinol phosphatase-like enzyme
VVERRVGDGNLTASTGGTALFLDRDGVLNEPVWDEHSGTMESPLKPSDVVLAAGAAIAVRRATDPDCR